MSALNMAPDMAFSAGRLLGKTGQPSSAALVSNRSSASRANGAGIVCALKSGGFNMFTHNYRGMFIHGYFDKPECRVTGFSIDPKKVFKSYRAAQLAIAAACKRHDAAMSTFAKGF